MYNKICVSGFVKTTYNLERAEYHPVLSRVSQAITLALEEAELRQLAGTKGLRLCLGELKLLQKLYMEKLNLLP